MNLLASFSAGLLLLNLTLLPAPSTPNTAAGTFLPSVLLNENSSPPFSAKNSALIKVLETIQGSRSIQRSA